MKELTALSPHGALSYSLVDQDSFAKGLERGPNFIGVDSGGLDLGSAYLGAEREHAPWKWYEHNLEVLIRGGRRLGIPVVVGNAGGNGTGGQVDRSLASVKRIAARNGFRFRVATIHADVGGGLLRRKQAEGKISGLGIQEPIDEATIARTTKATAMMGPEPIIRALEMGADVVLVGRCADDCIYAAIPIMHGVDPGIAHHLGKVLECGSLCTTPTSLEHTIVARISEDHFTVESASDGYVCNASSVAAHGMYERENPFMQAEPGGILDMRHSQYAQITPLQVKVSGSRFLPDSKYRVKLEGAAFVGYRAVDLKGIRDENMIAAMDEILERVRRVMDKRLESIAVGTEYQAFFHVYGRDAIMGHRDPLRHVPPHEIALVTEVVAPTQELALEICSALAHQLSHFPYTGRKATAGNLAYLVDPEPFAAGASYVFCIDHLMTLDDPLECFPITLHDL